MKDKIVKLFNEKFEIDQRLLSEYVDFCLSHIVDKKDYGKYECELHHILPKNDKCFPELKYDKQFQVYLLCKDHFIAHSLLAKMLPIKPITFAWNAMLNKTSKLRNKNLIEAITPELYQELKANSARLHKEVSKGKVSVFKDGKFQQIPKEEQESCKYPTWSNMFINVFEKGTNKRVIIRKEDYTSEKYYIHTNGFATYYNILTGKREWISTANVASHYVAYNLKIYIRNCCGIVTQSFVRKLNENNEIFGLPIKELKCRIMKS